jgi:GT2 family glycosyltransferase
MVPRVLAVAVLGRGPEPGLVDAVRSVLAQDPTPEVVVVHSDGPSPSGALRRAGLDVPVVHRAGRLMPGAARNLGVEASDAPWIAFLAGDCLARPGWVAGRLELHRGGAEAVASLLGNAYPRSRTACATELLLHHRRLAHTPPNKRLRLGVSYARTLFDRHGPFREDLRTGEDSEFNGRLRRAGIAIEQAEGVVTSHRNPLRPREFFQDQYMRGIRQVRGRASLGLGGGNGRLPLATLADVLIAWRGTSRIEDAAERRRLRSGWPLLLPGALAYSAGTLAGARRNGWGPVQ